MLFSLAHTLDLKVGFINATSLKRHIDQFRDFLLNDPSFDVMGVAESRLGDAVDDHLVSINGYSIIRQDRNTQGGGVILYIHNTLRAQILAHSDTKVPGKPLQTEFLMCKVWGDDNPAILICLIFRPSKTISFNANPDFLNHLRDFCSSYSHKVVMGDLNADLLSINGDKNTILNLADELSLQVVSHNATHRPPGSIEPRTWIDVMLVDKNDKILSYNSKIPNFHTSHNIIDVEIELFIPKPPSESFTYRKFKNITPENINEFLTKCDWTPFLDSNLEIEPALECLNCNIQQAIDHLAPLKTFTPKKNKPPWITEEIQLLINKRKAIERRYNKSKNAVLLNELILLSDKIEDTSELARNSFYQDHIDNALNNKQDIWRELRHLGLLPTPKSDLHGFSLDDLNSYFAGVSTSPTENLNSVEKIISDASTDGFKFTEVSLNDVILAVAHFNSQATGDDDIPQRIIAKSLPILGLLLVKLFNASLRDGIFPTAWKKSLLVAIKKKFITTSTSDFRPIALLCFLSKVLEKLAHDQITSFLRNSNLLDPLQTGFRQFSSTETALIKLTDDIRRGMKNRLVIFLLQFDFSKAFDSISPYKLLV